MGIRVALLACWAALCLPAAQAPASLRGTLIHKDGKPVIETAAHKLIRPEGEPETMAVLGDARLAGSDMELLGRYSGPEGFIVGPFYTSKSILVHKGGKTCTVSYWCPVCSIRAYTPGKCVCCQDETHLDLEELKPEQRSQR